MGVASGEASKHRTIVVDTKFTEKTLESGRFRKNVKTGHLYQLHAYMTNMAASDQPWQGIREELLGLVA